MKRYYFYDSSRPKDKTNGAYFWAWNEAMFGEKGTSKTIVSEEEINRLIPRLSKTKGERLLKLKEGSKLKLSHLHLTGDLMVYRMTQDEIAKHDKKVELEQKATRIRKQIYDKTKDLQEELRKIEKEIKKIIV